MVTQESGTIVVVGALVVPGPAPVVVAIVVVVVVVVVGVTSHVSVDVLTGSFLLTQ